LAEGFMCNVTNMCNHTITIHHNSSPL
jgi:hypothetical protein